MKIEPKQIKIREVFDGYADQGDDGVFAYGGRLAIRPPYQREFVYDNDQAESVIQTVLKGFPLNVMYWVKTSPDSYEVLDGQQRTLSVMQYLKHQYPITRFIHQIGKTFLTVGHGIISSEKDFTINDYILLRLITRTATNINFVIRLKNKTGLTVDDKTIL